MEKVAIRLGLRNERAPVGKRSQADGRFSQPEVPFERGLRVLGVVFDDDQIQVDFGAARELNGVCHAAFQIP